MWRPGQALPVEIRLMFMGFQKFKRVRVFFSKGEQALPPSTESLARGYIRRDIQIGRQSAFAEAL